VPTRSDPETILDLLAFSERSSLPGCNRAGNQIQEHLPVNPSIYYVGHWKINQKYEHVDDVKIHIHANFRDGQILYKEIYAGRESK
jgi:hypothetical protein